MKRPSFVTIVKLGAIFLPTIGLAVLMLVSDVRQQRKDFTQTVASRIRNISSGIYSIEDVPELFKRTVQLSNVLYNEENGNSWRLYLTMNLTYSCAELCVPNDDEPWQSKNYDDWDNESCRLFCFNKNLPNGVPRNERYTSVMALLGKDSPFEFAMGSKWCHPPIVDTADSSG